MTRNALFIPQGHKSRFLANTLVGLSRQVAQLSIITFFFLSLFLSGSAHASVVLFEHTGSTDPTTEGWTYTHSGGGGISTGPVVNDQGSGIDAWYVQDSSNAIYTTSSYWQSLSQAQLNSAALGWGLAVKMRSLEKSTGYHDYTMFAGYQDGATYWLMYFGLEDNGDQFVAVYTPTGDLRYALGDALYHTYTMKFDPATGTADLFIDNTERISNFVGVTSTTAANVSWGAGASNATGRAHYNLVQFQAVPLPGAVYLLGAGLAGIVALRKKR